MTDKQRRFVAEYLIDLNGAQAATRAGYSPRTAHAQASRLLSNAEVSEAVAQGKAQQLERAGISAQDVLTELARLSFSDVRSLFDAAGNLKALHTLTSDQAACIASVEIVKKNLAAGDAQTDIVHKIRMWDKPRALEMLAKHLGLLVERVEQRGSVEFRWQGESENRR